MNKVTGLKGRKRWHYGTLDSMCAASNILMAFGIVFAVLGLGGGFTVKHGGFYIGGAAGAVMLVLGILIGASSGCLR